MTSFSKTGHEFAALEEPTAANFNSAGFGWLGHGYNTSDQTSITGSNVDVSELTATCTVGTNRLIEVKMHAHITSVSTATYYLTFLQDGASIGRSARETALATGAVVYHSGFAIVRAPSAGSHIYTVQVTVTTGSLSISGTGGTNAHLLVTDLGSTT